MMQKILKFVGELLYQVQIILHLLFCEKKSRKNWVKLSHFFISRFYCELFFDKVLYAKTSSKTKSDILFWGENFAFKWV